MRSIPRIVLSFLFGLFFATTLSLYIQSSLRDRHSLLFNAALWGGFVLLFTTTSFFVFPSIYQRINRYGKRGVLLLILLCIGLSILVFKATSLSQLKSNNLMVFISIPTPGADKNQEIQIPEVKNGNRTFDLRKFQFTSGCKPAENLSIICEGISVIEYVIEADNGTSLPINILLFNRETNDFKRLSLNRNDNFLLLNNAYQNKSILWLVLWISHSLIMFMAGISLGVIAFCLLLFAGFLRNVPAGFIRISQRGVSAIQSYKLDRLAIILFIAITLIYVWLSTGGTMYKLYDTTYYYDYQTDAFLHGQANLLIEPAKELLALPDPYDPQANLKWRLHDASLYNGKYYIYWGPAPALVLLIFKYLFPGYIIRDQLLVLGFVIGIFFILMKFVLIISKEFFDNIPKWVTLTGIAVLGLAIYQTWLLGRPFIYEAAISGGQFFLLSGLYCAYNAFEKGHPKKLLLILAGIFWVLAIGSRTTQAVAIACLSVLTTWRMLRTPEKKYVIEWKSLAALFVPLLAGMFLLLFYNYIRFGSVMETGIKYILSGIRYENTFSSNYIVPNLYYYIARASTIKMESQFPFLDTQAAPPLELIPLPKEYAASVSIIGLLWVFPFVWIIPISMIYGSYFRKSISFTAKDTIDKSKLIWFGLCLIGTTLAIYPQLLFVGAAMRYFTDFLPGSGLLTFLIFCFLYTSLNGHSKAQNSLLIIFLFLAVGSMMIGFLLGINSEKGFTLFEDTNPALFNWLVEYIHF